MMEPQINYSMPVLNLPPVEVQVDEIDGKISIFDSLRKKYLVLTPEEWVRQHIILYLVQYKEYPRSLFALEKGLKYNTMQKRFDVMVMDRDGKPFLLVECKAPDVKLTQKTVEQVSVYNKILGAPNLCISNGLQHICLAWEEEKGQFRQLSQFPDFG
ncbi:type I restriction enzyme HsdR N-terminal domain-containing protein [Litoribacter populi]|uniref:type I restriction enzyme HsdR N-terminal domain-containing protein n=1 Tax=Litoribacter populi TaxID=2598460 RepID=UPI0029391008|nr:type I restriction enzyme HsdR N-terminal domain-containing protein [Litoribacter populi]